MNKHQSAGCLRTLAAILDIMTDEYLALTAVTTAVFIVLLRVLGCKSPHLICYYFCTSFFKLLLPKLLLKVAPFPSQAAGFCVGSVHGNMKLKPDVHVSCEMFNVEVK